MSINKTKHYFFAFAFMLLGIVLFAQKNRRTLEDQRKRLLDQIEFTENRISEVNKKKSASLDQLSDLSQKIKTREQLIQNINSEISILNSQIQTSNGTIKALQNDLSVLRKEYAEMVKVAYKNRNSLNYMLFVFSSNDYNQAIKRLRFIKQYNEYRTLQGQLINKTTEKLQSRVINLEVKVKEKEHFLALEGVQKTILVKETNEQKSLVKVLQKDEHDLKKKLRDQVNSRDKLNRAIEDLIRAEIEAARKKSTSTKPISNSEALRSTPDGNKLSNDFERNQGNLPWPVEKGYISSRFGKQAHPVLENVYIENSGLDIKTSENAKVRAVSAGTVSAIYYIRGMQNMIIVRHGEYLSVYAHVESVSVKIGQKVNAKDLLGTVYTDSDDNKTEVHFEIWKGFTKLDPEPWLNR